MNRPAVKNPTRADVARLAGVSTAVVSYVINDGPRPVSEQKRALVLDAVQKLNYRPNPQARALRLGTTSTYGVSVPDVINTFHASVVEGLDMALTRRGWSMLLATTHKDPILEEKVVDDMVDRGVDGVIVLMSASSDQTWLSKSSVPAVLMDRQTGIPGFVTIGSDFVTAGRVATKHLIDHGCDNIATVAGPLLETDSNPRFTGYREALAEARLEPGDSYVTAWTREGGYDAGQQIVASGRIPDGVFAFSDMTAIGLMAALNEAGLRVPEDVSVVCFDGTPAAEYAAPPLTSVTQPVAAMTEAAVEALAHPQPSGTDHREFPVSLHIRKSCGC